MNIRIKSEINGGSWKKSPIRPKLKNMREWKSFNVKRMGSASTKAGFCFPFNIVQEVEKPEKKSH
jgi:hypothetical protein